MIGSPVRSWVSTRSSLEAGAVDLPADVGARLADHEGHRGHARVGLDLGVHVERRVGERRPERRVVVDAEPVGRAVHEREVAVADQRPGRRAPARPAAGPRRTPRRRAGRSRSGCGRRRARRRRLRGLRGLGPERRQVVHDAEVGHAGLVEAGGGEAVGEVEVVGGPVPGAALLAAGRVDAGGVAEVGRAPRLVVGRPHLHPVAEALVDDHRVVGEGLGGAALEPAAAVLEGLGQVPVVERGGRLHAARQRGVDQPVVVVQPARLDARRCPPG